MSLAFRIRRGLFVLLCVAVVASACRAKKTRTLYLPSLGTEMDVSLSFPNDAVSGSASQFSQVCQGAEAILVSLDLDTAQGLGVDYRFLFGIDGTLFGCSAGACSGSIVQTQIAAPHRVIVEGIDVLPLSYESTSAFNVLCRGIADDTIPMGQISVTPAPPPTAAPSPIATTVLSVHVTVPMLRVGEMNGTFSNDGPTAIEAAAAPLGTPPTTRTADGGRIAVAGGETPYTTNIEVFDPRTIRFSSLGSTSGVRFVATATGVVNSAGRASVLFAGGNDLASGPASVELWDGLASTTAVLPLTGGKLRFYHAAVLFPGHVDQGLLLPVVVLLGGQDASTITPSFDFYFPKSPPDVSACVPGSSSGSSGVCRPSAAPAMGDGGHEQAAFGRISTPAGERVFVGAGAAAQPAGYNAAGYFFDPETFTYTTLSGTGLPNVSPATVSLTTALIGYFGGFTNATGVSSQWVLVRGRDSTQAIGPGSMKTPRNSATATLLEDRRVLIAGGDSSSRSLETYTPSLVSMTAGTFAFLAKHPTGSCATGADPGCVRFAAGRSSFNAVRIEGSRTWINGAVVFSGGSAPYSEIYVPAYACGGTKAVRYPDSAVIPTVDFCDRLRARQPLTNPDSPSRVAE